MPGAHVSPRSQPGTLISLAELAECGEQASSQTRDFVVARLLAAAPGSEPSHVDPDNAALIVCNREQICSHSFLVERNVGLIVNMCGHQTAKFGYPPSFANKVASFSVNWTNGRFSQLMSLVPEAAEVLASSQSIAIHCNQGFHRGPLGFAALAKMLFGIDPLRALGLLGRSRTIWHEYVEGVGSSGSKCWECVTWLRGLTMYNPRPSRPVPVWGAPAPSSPTPASPPASSQAPASSQSLGSSSKAAPPHPPPRVILKPSSKAAPARGKGAKKTEQKYLYRAMTASLTEFLDPGFEPNFKGEKLAVEMLDSVRRGSHYTSPFLHFSWDFHEARKWYTKGRELRGETTNLICQVDKDKLRELASASSHDPASSQAHVPRLGDGLRPGQILDISTRESTQRFLSSEFISGRVEDKLSALGHAHAVQEVLVAWRGKVDPALFEVIDADSGHLTVTVIHLWRTHNGRGKGKPSVTQQRAKTAWPWPRPWPWPLPCPLCSRTAPLALWPCHPLFSYPMVSPLRSVTIGLPVFPAIVRPPQIRYNNTGEYVRPLTEVMQSRDDSWLRAKQAHDDAQEAAARAEAIAAEAKADVDRRMREVAEREAAGRRAREEAEAAEASARRAQAWANMAMQLDRVAREQALRQAETAQRLRQEAVERQAEIAAAAHQAREDMNEARDQARIRVEEANASRVIADDHWLQAKRDAANADAAAREQAGDNATLGYYGVDLDTVDGELKEQLVAARREYRIIEEPCGHGCAG